MKTLKAATLLILLTLGTSFAPTKEVTAAQPVWIMYCAAIDTYVSYNPGLNEVLNAEYYGNFSSDIDNPNNGSYDPVTGILSLSGVNAYVNGNWVSISGDYEHY